MIYAIALDDATLESGGDLVSHKQYEILAIIEDAKQYRIVDETGIERVYHQSWFKEYLLKGFQQEEFTESISGFMLDSYKHSHKGLSLPDNARTLAPEDIQNLRKKEVEHIDTGFEGLVYVDPEVQEGYPQYLNSKDLSLDQINFLNRTLDFSDGDRIEPRVDKNSMCIVCFFYEDIFVDVEGHKKPKSDLHFNDIFQLSE